MNGLLTNIDQEWFAAALFHSFPDILAWDAHSRAYFVNGEQLGVRVFGTDMETKEMP